jgi:hypothetical protein
MNAEKKKRLLAQSSKFVQKIEIDAGDEKVEFDVRSISVGARLELVEKGRAAGEVQKDSEEPTSVRAGAVMAARLMAASLYEPGTLNRAFNEADVYELVNTSFFEELVNIVGPLLGPESARGKSPAAASGVPASPSPAP